MIILLTFTLVFNSFYLFSAEFEQKEIQENIAYNSKRIYQDIAQLLDWKYSPEQILNIIRENNTNVNAPDSNGYTALHWASLNNNLSAAQVLIDANANVNFLTCKEYNEPFPYQQDSPLPNNFSAYPFGNKNLVKQLIKRFIDEFDTDNTQYFYYFVQCSPMHFAILHNNIDMINLFIDNGYSILDLQLYYCLHIDVYQRNNDNFINSAGGTFFSAQLDPAFDYCSYNKFAANQNKTSKELISLWYMQHAPSSFFRLLYDSQYLEFYKVKLKNPKIQGYCIVQ